MAKLFIKGHKGYWLGKSFSEEHKEKIRKSMFGKHWKMSLEGRKNISKAHKGRKPTAYQLQKATEAVTGEKNHLWAGDEVGYRALHDWVVRNLGKPDMCEHCSSSGLNGRQINWANKSHQYLRDLNDWVRLCVSCHRAYDKINDQS